MTFYRLIFTCFSFLLSITSFNFASACGSWDLIDKESNLTIRMYASSTKVIQKGKSQKPKIFRADFKNNVFALTNGDKIHLANGVIQWLKKTTKKLEHIGQYSNSTFNLTNLGNFSVEKYEHINKYINYTIKNNNKKIATASIAKNFCTSSPSQEYLRIVAYYAWKSLKLDP